MIDFSKNTAFDLTPIPEKQINPGVQALLLDGEQILSGYKTIRDQVVFTNKRIITIDVKGITGKRQEFFSLPYARIQYFGVQTPGFAELVPDCELAIFFSNGMKASFSFKGQCNILEIGKMIGQYALN